MLLSVHPKNPQPRVIAQAVSILQKGGVIVYPTDSGYALGCGVSAFQALQRIRIYRQLEPSHLFTLLGAHIGDFGEFIVMGTPLFRFVNACLPGPYTFIFEATKKITKAFSSKRKAVGIRVPDHLVTSSLLAAYGEVLMSVSLTGDDEPTCDEEDWFFYLDQVRPHVDCILDAGWMMTRQTTVIDLTDGIKLLREGQGYEAIQHMF